MKKNGKYKYTIQFGAGTEEQVRAGELLEKLGQKKSVVIGAALNDYLSAHPDLLEDHGKKIEVKVSGGYDPDQVERLIRRIVDERIADLRPDGACAESPRLFPSQSARSDAAEDDITQMLDNLDLFQ